MSTDTNADTRDPRCLRDERPVRRCTVAASSALGRRLEAIVRHVAFWIAIAFPALYVVGSIDGVAPALPSGWLPLAIAANLLLLWIGHGAHHPE